MKFILFAIHFIPFQYLTLQFLQQQNLINHESWNLSGVNNNPISVRAASLLWAKYCHLDTYWCLICVIRMIWAVGNNFADITSCFNSLVRRSLSLKDSLKAAGMKNFRKLCIFSKILLTKVKFIGKFKVWITINFQKISEISNWFNLKMYISGFCRSR